MTESRYIKLTGNYYFDPIKRHILKKQGQQYSFVLHDRRRLHRPVTKDRRGRFEEMPLQLVPIHHELFWDAEGKNVYRKIKDNFVLYSRDRRKTHNPSPTGVDRRQSGGHHR